MKIDLSGNTLLVLLVFMFVLPSHAIGQETESTISGLLEEITVTARKREEGLQDTPIAVSAFTGANLEARGIEKLNGIMQITPNVSFYTHASNGGSNNNATLFIRGVGQSDFVPTTDPGVGIYVDGVYLARSQGAILDLIDVERIEVLRGPQGTLFGRNSVGGAITIHTQKPHHELKGKLKTKVGSDDRLNILGSINVPLTDTLFGSLSLASFNQDGYVVSTTTGQDFGDDETLSGRAALRWIPSDALEVNVSFDYSQDRENGPPRVFNGVEIIAPDPANPMDVGNDVFFWNVFLGANILGVNNCDATFANPAGTASDCLNNNNPAAPIGENSADLTGFFISDVLGGSITVDWSPSKNLDIKSITAYRKLDSHFSYDFDLTSVSAFGSLEDRYKQEQISQEIQLLGTALNDRLKWILGFYYFKESGVNDNPVDFVTISGLSGGGFENDSTAGFGQVTWDFTDKLHLTAGLRYTVDNKKFSAAGRQQIIGPNQNLQLLIGFVPALPVIAQGNYEVDADAFTPMFNIAYDINEELLTYVTYSEGFKSGGFQQRIAGPVGFAPTFEPEFLTSVELGLKYANADNDLVVNMAAFISDYEDIQIEVFRGIAPIRENAGNAEVKGFELEARWSPAETWFFEGALGYLDHEIDKLDPAVTDTFVGAKFAYVPDWTASAAILKEINLGKWGTIVPRIDWSYRDHIFFTAANEQGEEQEAYHVFNTNIAWNSKNDHFGLTLSIPNFTDEDYFTLRELQEGFGNSQATPARGREWYLTGEYRF